MFYTKKSKTKNLTRCGCDAEDEKPSISFQAFLIENGRGRSAKHSDAMHTNDSCTALSDGSTYKWLSVVALAMTQGMKNNRGDTETNSTPSHLWIMGEGEMVTVFSLLKF